MTSKGRNTVRTMLACIVLVWSSTNAFAQAPNALLTGASMAKDLEFPTKVSRFGFFSVPEMAVYKSRPEHGVSAVRARPYSRQFRGSGDDG